MQMKLGEEKFSKFVDGLSDYSRDALKGLYTCQKMVIKNEKNQNFEVARKIAKVKRPTKFQESN